MTVRQRIASKPAENLGTLASTAVFAAYALGYSTETVTVIGVVAANVPRVVTWVVDHGGIRGVVATFWRGRAK